jgi:hypothetical protein
MRSAYLQACGSIRPQAELGLVQISFSLRRKFRRSREELKQQARKQSFRELTIRRTSEVIQLTFILGAVRQSGLTSTNFSNTVNLSGPRADSTEFLNVRALASNTTR